MIQREKRQPSLDAAIELARAGIEPIWHLSTRGRTQSRIAAELARAREAGLRSVVCLRGDHAAADTPETPTLREAVAMARDALPGLVGATLNPYLERQATLRNLFGKLEAGARYLITQPLFELKPLLPWAEQIRSRFPDVPIGALTLPLGSREEAQRIGARLGIPMPVRPFSGSGDPGGWRSYERLLRELWGSGPVDALVVMTLALDPPPEFAARILRALPQPAGTKG